MRAGVIQIAERGRDVRALQSESYAVTVDGLVTYQPAVCAGRSATRAASA